MDNIENKSGSKSQGIDVLNNMVEVVEKLPEQKMEDVKRKMGESGENAMRAGMMMRHVLGRRMPPMG